MFDLDDTLIQAGSYISPRVLAALRAAHEAGYVLSISSGRPLCAVQPAVLRDGSMDFAVCANGATVTRLADGAVLARTPLSLADALDCHALLAPFGPAWNAFFGDRAYFEWKGASYMLTGRTGALARAARGAGPRRSALGRAAWFVRRGVRYVWRMVSNRRHRQVRSVLPYLRRAVEGVDKMGCTIVDADACARAARLLLADGRFEVVRMGATELEVTARGVTKGTGARALMEMLGADPRDCVAFGDGGNDLPLASVVGRFVAMGNADDEVKAAATDVCPPVGEDGVAVWIERELLA